MTVGAIDSELYGGLFSSADMRAVFSDEGRVQSMLEVEAALARAQAKLGLVPQEAADEITAKARLGSVDFDAVRVGTELTGYPIVPLVKALAAACAGDAGRYVHWGATTQDIMDTALVLRMRAAFALIEKELAAIERALAELARRDRDVVMAGRSHLQHALPITFGFKCATWLAPIQRHRGRLERLRDEIAVVQFAGAAGTLASLGQDGIRVMETLAAELGLRAPAIAWHTARDRLAEAVSFLGLLTGTLAKVATDIALLMQTEVAEVAEPYETGRGGSSTMPQKRNPIACEFVLACAANVRQLVPVMLGAMLQDHERATGPWHAEWIALPQAFALASGALQHMREVLEGLVVDTECMRRNLNATGGMINAEAVMMALAPAVGREEAHHIVATACRQASDAALDLFDVLSTDPHVAAHLTPERLRALLEPLNYTGLAGVFVDRVLARSRT